MCCVLCVGWRSVGGCRQHDGWEGITAAFAVGMKWLVKAAAGTYYYYYYYYYYY